MRETIRERLIQAVPAVGGRVYEPQAAGPDVEKPYLVLRQGVETDESPWAGFRRIIEVWPYVARTTFQRVDDLAQQIVTALDSQLLTSASGEAFTCEYMGTVGADEVDTEWDAISRGLRFAVLALQPTDVSETLAGDRWVEAVALWTQAELGQEWTVYRDVWPVGYRRPSTLWRMSRLEARPWVRSTFEVEKVLRGHVLGRTPNETAAASLQLVYAAQRDVKLPMDVDGVRYYLTVGDIKVDYEADGLTSGQLALTLVRRMNRPLDEIPYMQHVASRGAWR